MIQMKKVLKSFLMTMVAMVLSLGFVACSKNNGHQETVNLKGKWILMTEGYMEMLIINEDHTLLSTGADDEDVWTGIKGQITLDGDKFTFISEDGDNSFGTYKLEDNKLTLITDGETYVYNKLLEEFSMEGKWKTTKTLSFINAVKDELKLPFGSIVNGEEIPTVIQTANVKGEFVDNAINTYLRNIEFKSNGKITYDVVKEGEETPMTKNYELANNYLKVTGKVGSIDINNQFMAFQNPNQKLSFLLLTKENIADMFVGYGLMLREGNVSEGSAESLEEFKKEFMEVFENFATIIYLEKE